MKGLPNLHYTAPLVTRINNLKAENTNLKTAIKTAIALAERQGCSRSGCADGWHSPICPLGVIAPLREKAR